MEAPKYRGWFIVLSFGPRGTGGFIFPGQGYTSHPDSRHVLHFGSALPPCQKIHPRPAFDEATEGFELTLTRSFEELRSTGAATAAASSGTAGGTVAAMMNESST